MSQWMKKTLSQQLSLSDGRSVYKRSTDYDFSTSIPIIGGPKKSIPINQPILFCFVNVNVFVIMTITTILNEHLFELNIIHQ
jgi:hypothetical protein